MVREMIVQIHVYFCAYFHRSEIHFVVNVYFVNYFFCVSCLNTCNLSHVLFHW